MTATASAVPHEERGELLVLPLPRLLQRREASVLPGIWIGAGGEQELADVAPSGRRGAMERLRLAGELLVSGWRLEIRAVLDEDSRRSWSAEEGGVVERREPVH